MTEYHLMIWCSDNTCLHEEGLIKPSTTTAMMSQHIIKKLGLKPADFTLGKTDFLSPDHVCYWNNWNEHRPTTIVMPAFLKNLPVNEITKGMLKCAYQAKTKKISSTGVSYIQVRIFFKFHGKPVDNRLLQFNG